LVDFVCVHETIFRINFYSLKRLSENQNKLPEEEDW
jgi:hypothetical protein